MAQQAVLTLGNIAFLQREVPDTINFGGRQMLSVHRNLGGSRIIDAMGPDPAPIHWSGHFLTVPGIVGTAAARARAVDQLRKSGAQVTLAWGSFSYQVVVSHFDAVYKNEWEISYKITCVVLQDNGVQSFTSPTLDAVIANNIANVNVIASSGSSITTAMMSALSAAQTALTSAVGTGSLADLTSTQLQPVLAAFTNAANVFYAGSGTATGINLDAITGASTLDGINSLVAESNAIASESDVQAALGYINSTIAMLNNALGETL